VLDLAHGEHAVNDFAEDDVLAVEEVTFGGSDEELVG
jgi:hypothetical protein